MVEGVLEHLRPSLTISQTTMHNINTLLGAITPLPGYEAVPQTLEITVGTAESIAGLVIIIFSVGVAWGSLRKTVVHVEKAIEGDIKPDLKDVRDRVSRVERRVTTLWHDHFAPAASPRQLTKRGKEILAHSGIADIVKAREAELLALVKERRAKTDYDADEAVRDIMMALPQHCPDVVDTLKRGAFTVGADLDTVLFVGSVYLRDRALPKLYAHRQSRKRRQQKA